MADLNPVWLTHWVMPNGHSHITVTETSYFPGTHWREGGSWRFHPRKSRLRPSYGTHWAHPPGDGHARETGERG